MNNENAVNRLIMLGSISGFATVAVGAFGAHALQGILIANHMQNVYETGVQYQMMHTLAIFVCALLLERSLSTKDIALAGYFFFWGAILFSGSLYILAITNMKILGIVTPFGGLCFLIGWAILFKHAYQNRVSR